MTPNIKTPTQALPPTFLKYPPIREEIELFQKELNTLIDKINEDELENHNKTFLKEFFSKIYYDQNFEINEYNDTKNKIRVDLAVKQKEKTTLLHIISMKINADNFFICKFSFQNKNIVQPTIMPIRLCSKMHCMIWPNQLQ